MAEGAERRDAVGPLDGVRVLEAATHLAGPFAGMMLAQLGAEVIKVEPPAGDPARRFGLRNQGISAAFVNINQGKRALALDLKDPGGRSTLVELARGADVFLQNWRPEAARKLGLEPAVLLAANLRLLYVSVSGYGSDGPDAGAPVFDWIVQAATGMAVWESSEDEPRPTRAFMADKVTSAFVAQAVLAALLRRERTGRGGVVELSMLDALAYFNFPDIGQDRTFLAPTRPLANPRGRSGFLRTANGFVVVAPVTGDQIARALGAVDHADWYDDVRAAATPTEMTDDLFARLESCTRAMTTAEALARFRAADVPAGSVLTVDEHFEHPQTVHNELYGWTTGVGGPTRRVRHPMRLDGRQLPDVASAPDRPDALEPGPGWSS
jgi:crotonobetainyl-CoA:carnitine CoA-transferase CaiB-like acyl-CoA transferase